MKKVHYKILLIICSIVSMATMFLPLVKMREMLYGVKSYAMNATDFWSGDFKASLISAMIFDEQTADVIKGLLVLVLVVQALALMSTTSKKEGGMVLGFFVAGVANVLVSLYIWHSCNVQSSGFMEGMLKVTPDVGVYLLIAVGIAEVVFLVKRSFVREKSY